jgi:hypothetical protein
MRTSNTAASGLRAKVTRLGATARTIVAGVSALDPTQPVEAVQTTMHGRGVLTRMAPGAAMPVDLTDGLLELEEEDLVYQANASVLRASDRMIGMLFDISG